MTHTKENFLLPRDEEMHQIGVDIACAVSNLAGDDRLPTRDTLAFHRRIRNTLKCDISKAWGIFYAIRAAAFEARDFYEGTEVDTTIVHLDEFDGNDAPADTKPAFVDECVRHALLEAWNFICKNSPTNPFLTEPGKSVYEALKRHGFMS